MNILFFVERLSFNGSIGGAEKVMSTLVNNLDENQFNVTVQTVFPDKASDLLSNKIKYKPMFLKENRFSRYLYRIEAKLGLAYKLHMRGKYDIEVAYLEYGPTKVIASSNNKKAKKIAWVHCDFETAISDKKAFKEKVSRHYNSMDQIVCVSEKSKQSFCEIFGDEGKVTVIHNAIDTNEIIAKSEFPLPAEITKRKLTLLMVGRFFPQKNYHRLLATAKQLYEEGFDFDLWIIGDGVERPKIEKYIQENSMQEYVSLLGFQKNPYPFIKAADILVCSSNYEGYSTFVTEGLILGKPIFTTDCSGMRELLGDSEYGVIVDNDDTAFLDGLRKILLDSDKNLRNLEDKARLRSKDFELEKLVKDTEDYFINVVKQKKC